MIKIRILVAILSFTSMSMVYGLGVGDLLVESHLDQAFRGRVPLHEMGSVHVDEIRVRLAAAEDFEQAAIDFSDFLANLRFKIIKNAKNEASIKIQSDLAVQDPYINFILEISWGSGRLLKEFSAFIDPIELKPLPVLQPLPEFLPEPVLEPVSQPRVEPVVLESPLPLPQDIKSLASPINTFANPPLKKPLKQATVAAPAPVKKSEENKAVVHIPKKPLELLSPMAKPESLNQRLVMIEEILDTLAQNNKILKEKQHEYQEENQSLVALLKMKEQEIMQLKMLPPPEKSVNLLSIVTFAIGLGSILMSLIFIIRSKRTRKTSKIAT